MAPKKTTRRRVRKETFFLNSLPIELIEQVFLRLPASNLLQCISVCKMWREIIHDSQFAMAHLQHAPSCMLLFSPKGSNLEGLYPSDAVPFDEALSPSTWAVPVIGPDDLICGSCNGLLCLCTPTSTIKIANIATGEHLHLKKPTRFLKDDHFSFYKFGFHPITKEYKVIHFLQERASCTPGRCSVIQVYTLGDEKWKDVATPKSLSLSCVTDSGVIIVHGTMYWLTEDIAANWQHVVVSFDLAEENFAQIQLPAFDLEDLDFASHRRYWISEIQGKICVSTAQSIEKMLLGDLHIWALNENSDQSWSQMYTIEFSSLFARGIHFVHRESIIIQNHDSNLYSYRLLGKNIVIESNKMLKLLNLSPRGQEDMQFYSYVKSIVPLDVYEKAAIVHRPKRQGGWRLKKWKAWEHQLLMQQKTWQRVHEMERGILERTRYVGVRAKEISQKLPDEATQQHAITEIDQMMQHLPDCPDQHPSPVRRLNWVEKMQDVEKLHARIDGLNDTMKVSLALIQTQDNIISVLESYAMQISANPE